MNKPLVDFDRGVSNSFYWIQTTVGGKHPRRVGRVLLRSWVNIRGYLESVQRDLNPADPTRFSLARLNRTGCG